MVRQKISLPHRRHVTLQLSGCFLVRILIGWDCRLTDYAMQIRLSLLKSKILKINNYDVDRFSLQSEDHDDPKFLNDVNSLNDSFISQDEDINS